MDRMKTFLIYALVIIGFFALSLLLENGLLLAMYSEIDGEFDGYYRRNNTQFSMENVVAKACNVNGYISFDLINLAGNSIQKCYLKIDLYNEVNLLADTEYIEIINMKPQDVKHFDIKFKANHIERYEMSIVESAPDKSNIINILGWETDLTNVFGLGIDLSNVTIFGTKLTDMLSWSNIKGAGISFWNWFSMLARSIPLWGYGIGWLFIVGLL